MVRPDSSLQPDRYWRPDKNRWHWFSRRFDVLDRVCCRPLRSSRVRNWRGDRHCPREAFEWVVVMRTVFRKRPEIQLVGGSVVPLPAEAAVGNDGCGARLQLWETRHF